MSEWRTKMKPTAELSVNRRMLGGAMLSDFARRPSVPILGLAVLLPGGLVVLLAAWIAISAHDLMRRAKRGRLAGRKAGASRAQ